MFFGKFGDSWIGHHDKFVTYSGEWDLPESDYPDYLKETLSGDVLNFIEDIIRHDKEVSWTRLSGLVEDRHANMNRRKEVSDRLHSLRYEDLDAPGDAPANIIERIKVYIDKHTPIEMESDQTDEAKARFFSTTTRGQEWDLYAKGRISTSETYERTAKALATSIKNMAEHEEGRSQHKRNKRSSYQRR